MTWIPRSCSDPPNQPLRPYTKINASPATTGDTDTGRSISAFSTLRPGNRYRVSSRADVMPNTVLISTASAATSQRQADRRKRLGRGDRSDEGGDAVFEGAQDHHAERQHDQHCHVPNRDQS